MAGHLDLKRGIGARISQERTAMYNDGTDSYVQHTTIDSAAVSSGNYPVGRPTGTDSAYSMEAWLYLKVTKAPDNYIRNVRFWGTGSNPAGIIMFVGTSASTAYTPTSDRSTKAIYSATEYASNTDYMIWSQKNLTAIGDKTSALIMQVHVTSAAAQGDLYSDDLTMHYAYDEA